MCKPGKTALILVVILAYSLIPRNPVAVSAAEATPVGGQIRRDTVWTKENNPYVLEDDLTVPAGISLTIEEGVVIDLNLWSIIVEGELRAFGSPDDKICFNISMPPLNDNEKARIYFTPESRPYKESNQGCLIEHARITCADYSISYGVIHANRLRLDDVEITGGLSHWKEYAVKTNGTVTNCLFDGLYRGVLMPEGSVTYNRFLNTRYSSAVNIGSGEVKYNIIDGGRSGVKVKNALVKGNTIINQQGPGILVNSYGDPGVSGELSPIIVQNTVTGCESAVTLSGEIKPTMVNNVFTDNVYGVCFEAEAFHNGVKPNIEYNVFYGNEYDVYSYREDPRIEVNLDNNWWGTSDPEVIDAKIYDVKDNPRLCSVKYTPILDEPPLSLPKSSCQLTLDEPNSAVEVMSDVVISGKVVPSFTLLSVHVTCEGPDGARVEEKTVTGSEGEFTLLFAPTSVGPWSLTVALEDNGLIEADPVEVEVNVTKRSSGISLICSPAACFVGEGVAVEGVLTPNLLNEEVTARVLLPDGSKSTGTARTDGEGAFTYWADDDQPGVHTVTFNWPGTAEYRDSTGTLVYRVYSPCTLSVVVFDESGSPVQGAAVSSTSQPAGQATLSGVTDSRGTLTFEKILPGSYTLDVEKGESEPSVFSLNLPEGEPTLIQHTMDVGTRSPSEDSPVSGGDSSIEGDPWYLGFIPSALTFVVLVTLYAALHKLRR